LIGVIWIMILFLNIFNLFSLTAKNMSSRATFTEVRLGIMGGYTHAVTWQIVDTRQVALLLIFIVVCLF
jgi:hypothetical protein